MPPHPNFELRSREDQEAAIIGTGAVLQGLIEELEVRVDRERIRSLVGQACADDMNMIARAQWFAGWILGDRSGLPPA